MKINFTKKQFEVLLKAVYLGNWVVNSTEAETNNEDFDKLEEYIFSFAKEFGLGEYATYVEDRKMYYPSTQLEESPDVGEYIDNFEAYVFWEELVQRLARRDMSREYGEEAMRGWSMEEYFKKEEPFLEKYDEEFEENGLDNLMIKPTT